MAIAIKKRKRKDSHFTYLSSLLFADLNNFSFFCCLVKGIGQNNNS